MSKAGKTQASIERKKKKAARKAANAAAFAGKIAAGTNTKENKAKKDRLKLLKPKHAMANCGNTGCTKCNTF